MAETNEKKEGGEKKEQAKGKKAAAPVNTLAAEKKKEAWTLEKCVKSARRFQSETEWSAGAPASYKSATAHGWVKQCLGSMAGGAAKTTKTVRKSA